MHATTSVHPSPTSPAPPALSCSTPSPMPTPASPPSPSPPPPATPTPALSPAPSLRPPSRRGRARPPLGPLDTSPRPASRIPPSRSAPAFVAPFPLSPQHAELAPDDAVSAHPTFQPPSRGGISCILPAFLYVGPDVTCEADVRALEDLGIQRVLNMAYEVPASGPPALNLPHRLQKYLRIPLQDTVAAEGVQDGIARACAFLGASPPTTRLASESHFI